MPDNKIITDREEMFEAVKKDGWALKYASDTLKADREVVIEAVRSEATYPGANGRALVYADDSLKALELFQSEMREWPHPRSSYNIEYEAQGRARMFGCEYIEAIMLLRKIQ